MAAHWEMAALASSRAALALGSVEAPTVISPSTSGSSGASGTPDISSELEPPEPEPPEPEPPEPEGRPDRGVSSPGSSTSKPWQKRMRMVATSARLALPVGSRAPLSVPVRRPTPTAHFTASTA